MQSCLQRRDRTGFAPGFHFKPQGTFTGNLGLAAEIRKAREKAKGIIGVNVMVALSDFAELVKTSIAEKVDIIFSGAGLPLDLPSFLKKDSAYAHVRY